MLATTCVFSTLANCRSRVKLSARLGYKKAITALAHRLCRILYAILRDGTEFDPARLGLEKGPFQVTRTRMYRLRKVPPTKR